MPGFRPSGKVGGKAGGKEDKLTGGHWVSIHGHPVYLKGGRVARGGKAGVTHDAAGKPSGGRPLTAPHDMILDGKLHKEGSPIRPALYRRAPREMRRAIDEGHAIPPRGSGTQVVAVRHEDRVVARPDGPRAVYSPGTRNHGFSGAVVEGGRAHALVAGRRAFALDHPPGEAAARRAARRYAALKGDRTPDGPEHIRTANPHRELGAAARHHGFDPYHPGDFAWSMGHKDRAEPAIARDNRARDRRAVRDFRDEAKLAGHDWKMGRSRARDPKEADFAAKAVARGKVPVVVTVRDRGGKPESERVAVDHLGQVASKLNRTEIHGDPRRGQRVRVRILTPDRTTPVPGFRPKS